jgi:hypothetical protein
MKNTITVLCIGLLLFAGCKKNDLNENSNPNDATESSTFSAQWKQYSNWVSEESSDGAIIKTSIQDSAITEDLVASGLILTYLKNENGQTENLPIRKETVLFYQQAEKGAITIYQASDNKSHSFNKSLNYSYITFTADELNSLKQDGTETTDILSMSYNEVLSLKH